MFDKETNTFFKSTIELYFHKKKVGCFTGKNKVEKNGDEGFFERVSGQPWAGECTKYFDWAHIISKRSIVILGWCDDPKSMPII